MKKIIYIIIFLICMNQLYAQNTYQGNITVTTQADLNFIMNFGNYNSISGNLTIGGTGTNINDLGPLNRLEEVGGNLTISNILCNSLNGLQNLSHVNGSITIRNNALLVSLNHLSSLEEIGTNIEINNNELLDNYCTLSSIAANKLQTQISITGNKYDPTYAQLTSSLCSYKVYQGDITLSTYAELTNFWNLGYMEVDGNVIIDEQVPNTIKDLHFLDNLQKVTGDMHIIWNYGLKSLFGLRNLHYVGGNLHIGDNDSISSLYGLQNVTYCGGILQIHSNSQLVEFCHINELASNLPDSRIQIHSNPFNPTRTNFLAADCSRPWYIGNITLSTQQEIESFANKGYTYISGNLTINDASGTSITRLTNLNSIDSIGGILQITACRDLPSLDGIAEIQSVSAVALTSLNGITRLTGFENIKQLNSGLTISACPYLESIDAFDQLTESGSIIIIHCQSLNQISGFSNIKQVKGYLTIKNLDALTEVSNFSSVDKLWSLYIEENEILRLISFPELDTITNTLQLTANNAISILDNFDALRSIGTVFIGTNKQLAVSGNKWLRGYCDLSAAITKMPSKNVHIENNFYNPDSITFTKGYCIQTEPQVRVTENYTVTERSMVQLDASASFDYQNDTINFTWNSPIGIELSDIHSAKPVFTAPMVDEDITYQIQLTIDDGYFSVVDTVKVMVNPAELPVANAGIDRLCGETNTVILDGTASFDPDDIKLSYSWKSLDEITLSDTTSANPVFTAPYVEDDTHIFFVLTVSNGFETSLPDTVSYFVYNNTPPVALCNSDYYIREGRYMVVCDSNSYDPDKGEITYHWLLPEGIEVEDTTQTVLTIQSPFVNSDTNLIFQLFTYDGIDYSLPDTVVVTVLNNNKPLANAGDNQAVDEGDWVEFSAYLSSDADGDSMTYKWYLPDAIEASTTNEAVVKFNAPSVNTDKTFRLSLVVNDGIDESEPVYVDLNVIDISTTISSIDNSLEIDIEVWPNPFANQIFVKLDKEYSELQYQLISTEGRIVDAESFQNTTMIHRYLQVPAGVYILCIKHERTILFTNTLLKK